MTTSTLIAQYRIESSIGSSTFTETYRAVDIVSKRLVALKILKPRALPKGIHPLRFLEAAQPATELVHPHLAWLWETGEDEGQYYLVERFIEGPTLAERLRSSGPVSWEQARPIIQHIAQGLDFAHSQGRVHVNIHPNNIRLNPELGAVLTGFGTAIAIHSLALYPNTIQLRDAAWYTAPEIWQGQPPSEKSDQYALACVVVELLTGEKPFAAQTLAGIQARHLAQFEPPPSWAAKIPWPVASTLQRALDVDPGRRHRNMIDFAEAPARLSDEDSLDPQLKETLHQQMAAWEEIQIAFQQEAEETARLARLDKARQEMQEELRRRSQADEQYPPTGDSPVPVLPPTAIPGKTQPRAPRPKTRRIWVLWVAVLLLLAALGGLWWDSLNPGGILPLAATPTQGMPTASLTPEPSASATPTQTTTSSPTVSPTPKPTASPTEPATPTITPTFTSTPTITRSPTPTRTPKDEE